MDYLQEYQRWLASADADTVQELTKIQNDDAEIKDRFYRSLEFGTAGLSGRSGNARACQSVNQNQPQGRRPQCGHCL